MINYFSAGFSLSSTAEKGTTAEMLMADRNSAVQECDANETDKSTQPVT
jgi:hypothetical protein